jgi:chromosome segregation ATPase
MLQRIIRHKRRAAIRSNPRSSRRKTGLVRVHDGSLDAHGGGTALALEQGMMKETKMNEQEFQTKLAELMGEISTLPVTERQKLEKLATETRQRHERLRQTVSSLQESLDYLRLSIKYLVFDLEATRRENGYLRKMLEETSGNND